jgi:DNA-binding transcriptional LysR family regulator
MLARPAPVPRALPGPRGPARSVATRRSSSRVVEIGSQPARGGREVARQSSFNKAALRLGYVQSTISAQIHALESELGVRLFDRLGRTVVLAVAGEALFPHAEQLLELSEQARASVAAVAVGEGRLEGSIMVSAPESLLTYRLPTVLSTFRTRYPG